MSTLYNQFRNQGVGLVGMFSEAITPNLDPRSIVSPIPMSQENGYSKPLLSLQQRVQAKAAKYNENLSESDDECSVLCDSENTAGNNSPNVARYREGSLRGSFSSNMGMSLGKSLSIDDLRKLRKVRKKKVVQFSFVYRATQPLGEGSERGAIATLIATALGSGVLSLPYTFAETGIIFTTGLLLFSMCLSILSLTVLMMAARYTGARSYSSLLSYAAQTRRIGQILDGSLFIYGVGSVTALFVLLGDFIPGVFSYLGYKSLLPRSVIIVGAACIAFPFTLPKDLSILRYVSILSVFSILGITIAVIVRYPDLSVANERHQLNVAGEVLKTGALINSSNGNQFIAKSDADLSISYWPPATTLEGGYPRIISSILKTFSITLFGFMCHMNAVPVSKSLEDPSLARLTKVAFRSSFVSFLVYFSIGLFGYLTYKSDVRGDFMLSYPDNDLCFWVCRVLYSFVASIGLVMNINPSVNALENLVESLTKKESGNYSSSNLLSPMASPSASPGNSPKNTPLGKSVSRSASKEAQNGVASSGKSTSKGSNRGATADGSNAASRTWMFNKLGKTTKRIILILITLVICCTIAVASSDLAKIISFLGALFANLFMLLVPAFVYYRLMWPLQQTPFKQICVFALLLGSIMAFMNLFI